MKKVKYLLCAFILSILLTGIVKADGPYYLEYETDMKENMMHGGNYQYKDGIITFDNDDDDAAVLTTYDSKGKVLKTKEIQHGYITTLKTSGEKIYVNYNESGMNYLGYFDSDLSLVRRVAVPENSIFTYFIHEDIISIKDDKIYFLIGFDTNPQTNQKEVYVTKYKSDLTNPEQLTLTVEEAGVYYPEATLAALIENVGFNEARGFDHRENYAVLTIFKYKNTCSNSFSSFGNSNSSSFNAAPTTPVGAMSSPFEPPENLNCFDLKLVVYKSNLSTPKWEKDLNDYKDAFEVRAFKNFIAVIGQKETGSDILLYDYEGNLIQKITSDESDFYNIADKENGFIVTSGWCRSARSKTYSCQPIHQVYNMYHKIEYKITDGKGKIEVTNHQKAGEPVKFTVIPDEGYELGVVKVTDANGQTVTFTNNTFTMPSADVTIEVTFVKKKVNPKTADVAIILTASIAVITALTVLIQYRKVNLIK